MQADMHAVAASATEATAAAEARVHAAEREV